MAIKLSDEAKAALDRITGRDGRLYPKAVIESARPVDSPLHHLITWDPVRALEKCQMEEAKAIIREYPYEVTISQETFVLPAYVKTPGHKDSYTRTVVVLSDAEQSRHLLVSEMKAVSDRMGRAEKFAKVLQADGALSDLRAQVTAFMARVASAPDSDLDAPQGTA